MVSGRDAGRDLESEVNVLRNLLSCCVVSNSCLGSPGGEAWEGVAGQQLQQWRVMTPTCGCRDTHLGARLHMLAVHVLAGLTIRPFVPTSLSFQLNLTPSPIFLPPLSCRLWTWHVSRRCAP